ncbi:MAG: enoyl-CoA hydratase/isomerase family protein [Candidatus Tectomicrobia bacterium]|uniref:Enoyl-CoA hydratase/isomerase family protein n=1 Tax=Tectimicrobiota bacterium TaxID=2528274 RepID=A0A937W237_UNCTE|nr:enoyl-CoA hydratase/isomerase family protein [Candidatus Tectomicrobia bacterium]
MAYQFLLYEHTDAIVTLTLNRPDRLNALGDTLREELYDAIVRTSDDPDARVIVMTGAGRGFCAGGDMKSAHEIQEGRQERALLDRVAPLRDKVVLAMRDSPKPIIAAVNGPAAGAGMNLALACDMRIASTAARFGQTFVKRGLHVDWGGTYFLPRLVGMAKACELIFTGEMISAEEANALGLLNQLVAPEALMPTTYALARKLADGPPIAIRLAKRALYHSQDVDLRSALEFETFAQNACRDTEDAREGIRAFVEKRTPRFQGR